MMGEGVWSEMLKRQKQERVALVKSFAEDGHSKSEAATFLGITRQQLQLFCKVNNIEFKKEKKT
jgi:hypothetical protein